jgi:molybdenum cofactor biosynthesis enzyme MoaA
MIDPFGRSISYLRVSVTDRCDLRCVYCMAEDMTFLPKAEVLSLEELDRLCGAFIALGVQKIRLTGGEPLVRRNVMSLVESLGARLGLITPMTHNFCESCNRVRLTCTGTLYMCLGQEDAVDLRAPLRDPELGDEGLRRAILDGIARKPKGHDFVIERARRAPAVARHMSVTGG